MSKNKANQKNGLIKRLANLKSEEDTLNGAPTSVDPEITGEGDEVQAKVVGEELNTVEAVVAEPTILFYRGSLLPINRSIVDLAIKSPITHDKTEVPGLGVAIVLATVHYGEILILEKDIEAAAEELASNESSINLARELYHLGHSKYRTNKPKWLAAFEASL